MRILEPERVIGDLPGRFVLLPQGDHATRLILREPPQVSGQGHLAELRGRGVVIVANHLSYSDANVIEVLLQLQDILPQKRGTTLRLADWFFSKEPSSHVLPMNPRASRPIPPLK